MIEKTILFTEKRALLLPTGSPTVSSSLSLSYATTISRNLEAYGFYLTEESIRLLANYSTATIKEWAIETMSFIEYTMGVRPRLRPFYPNFPQEVIEASDMELYLTALIHYATGGEWTPDDSIEMKYPLLDFSDLTPLHLLNETVYDELFTQMLQLPRGLSDHRKEFVKWYLENYKDKIIDLLPTAIPSKEVSCWLCANLPADSRYVAKRYLTNATDVLRLAVALSDGDVSLSETSRFKSFKRSERKWLIELLSANDKHLEEELWSRREMWLRFNERVHVFEYKKMASSKVVAGFKNLIEGNKPDLFNSTLEAAFESKDLIQLIGLLSTRPALFARSLNRLLVIEAEKVKQNYSYVAVALREVVHQIPFPILSVLPSYLESRMSETEYRAFFIKSSKVTKSYLLEEPIKPLPTHRVELILSIINEELSTRCQAFNEEVKVYLDDSFKQYLIPTTQRNSSKAFQTIERGSRLQISDETDVVRPFVYWKEENGNRCDLDLSVVFLNNELMEIGGELYFGNPKVFDNAAIHSGDYVSAKEGACEYADLNLEALAEQCVKYAMIVVNSFNGVSFANLGECFAGWMERDGVTGEAFEVKTVKQKFDLTANSTYCVPAIIDVENREMIWADLAFADCPQFGSVHNAQSMLYRSLKSLLVIHKPTLHDLFMWHIDNSPVIQVDNEEEADIVIGGEAGLQATDSLTIMNDYYPQ